MVSLDSKVGGRLPILEVGGGGEGPGIGGGGATHPCKGEILLDRGSSTRLSDQSRVMVELALCGMGPVGRVPVPSRVWEDWADPEFGRVGGRVDPTPIPMPLCCRLALQAGGALFLWWVGM